MRYDVEADWQLLNTCNFRCTYCFFDDARLGEKLRTFATPEQWRTGFDATGKVWLLHMTGGEPTIYPRFAELCSALTERNYISVNSNLTCASFLKFAEQIDPARVSFINAGLHLDEREGRSAVTSFLRHAEALNAAGFPVFASYVATPEALDRFDEAAALLRPLGLYPVPKLLRGNHAGRFYPNGYTAAARQRFKAYMAAAREFYAPKLARMSEPPSINMFDDDRHMLAVPSFKGLSCDAGRRFVHIEPNGDVHRCSSKLALGNLLDGTFTPLAGPKPCDTSYCFYFCKKYADVGAIREPTLLDLMTQRIRGRMVVPPFLSAMRKRSRHRILSRPGKSGSS
jgi:MoaA/NifB/PqqE/SkfB family radical SAM enzyme